MTARYENPYGMIGKLYITSERCKHPNLYAQVVNVYSHPLEGFKVQYTFDANSFNKGLNWHTPSPNPNNIIIHTDTLNYFLNLFYPAHEGETA